MSYRNRTYLLSFALFSFLLIDGSLAARNAKVREAPLTPQVAAKNKENLSPKFQPIIIKNEISYGYNYDNDDRNFEPHFLIEKGKTIRDYTVFVNIHDGSELNISSNYKPGTRTLSWATPYEAAMYQGMSALKHSHDQSALLTSWTGRKLRQFISFVIIPQGTQMEFKIGYASPQRSTNPNALEEYRPGGGIQLRLKYLPVGTIVLTKSLTQDTKIHGRATYALDTILTEAIDDFNNASMGIRLPHSIGELYLAFKGVEGYVDSSFEKHL